MKRLSVLLMFASAALLAAGLFARTVPAADIMYSQPVDEILSTLADIDLGDRIESKYYFVPGGSTGTADAEAKSVRWKWGDGVTNVTARLYIFAHGTRIVIEPDPNKAVELGELDKIIIGERIASQLQGRPFDDVRVGAEIESKFGAAARDNIAKVVAQERAK